MLNNDLKKIQQKFRSTDEAKYIHRLHGVFLVFKGLSTVKAGELLNEPQRTIAEWAMRYKVGGLDALRDATRSGRPNALTPEQEYKLKVALAKPPQKASLQGNRWTGELVSKFIRQEFRVGISLRNSHRIFQKLKSR
jgi:transposase